jgi:hypothetical protein
MTQVSTRGAPFFPTAPAQRLMARVIADHDGNLTAASLGYESTGAHRIGY